MSDPVVTQPPQPGAQTYELTMPYDLDRLYIHLAEVLQEITEQPCFVGQRVTVIVHPPEAEAPQVLPPPDQLDVTISMETAGRLLDYDDSALDELTIAVDSARHAAAEQLDAALARRAPADPPVPEPTQPTRRPCSRCGGGTQYTAECRTCDGAGSIPVPSLSEQVEGKRNDPEFRQHLDRNTERHAELLDKFKSEHSFKDQGRRALRPEDLDPPADPPVPEPTQPEHLLLMEASPSGRDCLAMLWSAYQAWAECHGCTLDANGKLTGPNAAEVFEPEQGVHRFIRMVDGKRQTDFISVSVDGETVEDRVRVYVFDPYTMAKDYRSGIETEDVAAVMAGDFSTISAAGGAVPVDPAAPKNANEETTP